jgi:outer membrane protein assembly factor BamE
VTFNVKRRDVSMNRLLAAILLAVLAGCNYVPQMVTPYRMEIQQGNFLTQDMLSQLKPGMTKEQVRFLLGTPLVVDPFHADRWDYVFTRVRENNRNPEQRKITVFFDKAGTLERISGDVVVSGAAKPAATAQQETK